MKKLATLMSILFVVNCGFSEPNSTEEKLFKLETKIRELEKKNRSLRKR